MLSYATLFVRSIWGTIPKPCLSQHNEIDCFDGINRYGHALHG